MTDTNDLMLAGMPTPRAAGEVQISALPEATTPISETDITNIKQGVEDKKVTVKDLLAPHADKTGNVHNMTKADLNLGNVMNYPITDAVNDKDSQKYASAMAVALVSERLDKQTPVGHLLLSLNPANPSTLGYVGTWDYVGKGRTLIGYDPADAQRPIGSEIGFDSCSIGVNNMPAHSVKVTGTVGDGGGHLHSVNISTQSGGEHSHAVNIGTTQSGDHTHPINMSTYGSGAHSHSFSGSTSNSGVHHHTIPFRANGGVGGRENDIMKTNSYGGYNASVATSDSGQHTHSFSGGTSGVGDHQHSIVGNTHGAGNHTHTVSGNTNSAASHVHNVSGNTASVGNHTHSIDLTSQSIGGGQPISVVQKSLIVYFWQRTA